MSRDVESLIGEIQTGGLVQEAQKLDQFQVGEDFKTKLQAYQQVLKEGKEVDRKGLVTDLRVVVDDVSQYRETAAEVSHMLRERLSAFTKELDATELGTFERLEVGIYRLFQGAEKAKVRQSSILYQRARQMNLEESMQQILTTGWKMYTIVKERTQAVTDARNVLLRDREGIYNTSVRATEAKEKAEAELATLDAQVQDMTVNLQAEANESAAEKLRSDLSKRQEELEAKQKTINQLTQLVAKSKADIQYFDGQVRDFRKAIEGLEAIMVETRTDLEHYKNALPKIHTLAEATMSVEGIDAYKDQFDEVKRTNAKLGARMAATILDTAGKHIRNQQALSDEEFDTLATLVKQSADIYAGILEAREEKTKHQPATSA